MKVLIVLGFVFCLLFQIAFPLKCYECLNFKDSECGAKFKKNEVNSKDCKQQCIKASYSYLGSDFYHRLCDDPVKCDDFKADNTTKSLKCSACKTDLCNDGDI